MNLKLKMAVATVLSAGAALMSTGASALGVVSSGSSDLVLFVQDTPVSGPVRTYALDTGIALSTLLPPGSLLPSGSASFTGITPITLAGSFSKTIAESSTLSTFLAGDGAGDTVIWGVEGGQFTGSTASVTNVSAVNAGVAVFSSVLGTTNQSKVAQLKPTSLANLLNAYNNPTGTPSALAATLAGISPTATETTSATWSAIDQAKASVFGNSTGDVQAPGPGTLDLFGITGNGNQLHVNQSYLLGTVSFNNGVLTITGNSGGTTPVPVPAAIWLLGSGLMGLFGVSRRRAAAAV